jgi:hypothetical protein
VKLVASSRDQSYVPFTVRDPRTVAPLLVIDAVTTWEAYNEWGGCTLYKCVAGSALKRAHVVSFDRPYPHSQDHGSGEFLSRELPLIALAEEQGYDITYATSIDLHEHPDMVLGGVKAVLSLGHDEYYSSVMRKALVSARDAGVNLAFFGANAIYRHVRLEPAPDGRKDRLLVNYRNDSDPMLATNPAEVTVQWREQGPPEAAVVGIQYACAGLDDDLVVVHASHWIWAGTNLHDGQHLPKLVGQEADALAPSSPANIDMLAASPIVCLGAHHELARVSYYSAPSGAGVFAAVTNHWVCALDAHDCSVSANITPIRVATINVLAAFAAGPAGRTHPSTGSG